MRGCSRRLPLFPPPKTTCPPMFPFRSTRAGRVWIPRHARRLRRLRIEARLTRARAQLLAQVALDRERQTL